MAVKIKFCGMRRQEDIDRAMELGAEFCGFIFHAKSPRHIQPEVAATFNTGGMKRVGVFVEQDLSEILTIMKTAKLDYAQLHGLHDRTCARKIGIDRVIRVLWPQKAGDYGTLQKHIDEWQNFCAFYLVDSGVAGGGHGEAVNLQMLRDVNWPLPWFLAGGLAGHNIEKILNECAPYALDINSCVEDKPGCKNHEKMKLAVEAAGKELK